MRLWLSSLALLSLIACGKKIEDRTQKHKSQDKFRPGNPETWNIYSESPLPSKLRVVVNNKEFANECTGLGDAEILRYETSGEINIRTNSTLRDEYFDIDLFDCLTGEIFYSEDYIDETDIVHPKGGPVKIVLRLRN